MGSLANTLFTLLLGWVQAAASSIWSAFTTENGGSFFRWIGRNWIILAVILCVIGLIVDLGIYLFRWRPLRVWKSYFNRLRHKEESLEESEQPESPVNSTPIIPRRVFRHEEENETIPELKTNPPQTGQEDCSRWEKEEPEAVYTAEPVQKKQIITGAGYTVPADSPPDGTKPEEGEANKPEIMTQKKRRRRLVVGELFNDPEEELWQYEKPQQLIDKDKAYHQPVYPRNWKTDEGENE